VTRNFAAVEKQLAANPALYARRTCCVSFDPEHDTPERLRAYGATYIGSDAKNAFAHWDFAVPEKPVLLEMARFFDLGYDDQRRRSARGTITHTLSTTLIGPGRQGGAFYPGNEWTAEQADDGYFNQSVLVICYDMSADTYVGKAYTGSMEPISYFTGVEKTEIMEATYLVNELNVDGGLNAPLAVRGALSLAIWEIMNPSSTTKSTPFPTDPAALPYEAEAAAAVASGAWTIADANQYQTWVPGPDDIGSIQRFGEYTPTPEPTTFVLTGLGLLGIGVVIGRSKTLSQKNS
jgi:hypothetical protein